MIAKSVLSRMWLYFVTEIEMLSLIYIIKASEFINRHCQVKIVIK